MKDNKDIFEQARLRARDMGLAYAGALLPREAHELLRRQPGARLIDVRSRAELDYVGRIPGSIEIEWKFYPGMQPNPNFMEELGRQVPHDAVAMFVCRSGVR